MIEFYEQTILALNRAGMLYFAFWGELVATQIEACAGRNDGRNDGTDA